MDFFFKDNTGVQGGLEPLENFLLKMFSHGSQKNNQFYILELFVLNKSTK